MTGFGRGEHADGKRVVTAEVRAVNHRYGEVSVRLPRRYSFAEEKLKALVRETAQRGKIEVNISVESVTESDSAVRLNMSVARQYYENLREMKAGLGLEGEVDLRLLASMPDVMRQAPDVEDEDEVLNSFSAALRAALGGFDAMRATEGRKLADDLLMRGRAVAALLEGVEGAGPEIARAHAEKLRERIRELLRQEAEIPEERIAVEAAMLADKCDVTEEIVRLKSHIAQLEGIVAGPGGAKGKKLDFLVQEMNREVNTIGSKANDLRITNIVLEMKSEIERMREQIQNVE